MVAAYLYFFLPLTSTFFYEFYHLVNIDFIYWFYSAFKVASVYLPRSEFFELMALVSGGVVSALILLRRFFKARKRYKIEAK